jgi:hypothetical protein
MNTRWNRAQMTTARAQAMRVLLLFCGLLMAVVFLRFVHLLFQTLHIPPPQIARILC